MSNAGLECMLNDTSTKVLTSDRSLQGRPALLLSLALTNLGCAIEGFGYEDGAPDANTDGSTDSTANSSSSPTTGTSVNPTEPTTSTSGDPSTDSTTEPTTGGTDPLGTTGTAETTETSPSGTTGSDETTGTTGGEQLPDAPVLKLSLSQIKQFNFSWTPVAAERYELHEQLPGQNQPHLIEMFLAGTTTWSQPMPLHFRMDAKYVLKACNGAVCSDSNEVQPANFLVDAVGYVKASNTGAGDAFGYSIALSGGGTTLAVGAPREKSKAQGVPGDDSADSAGAVYVFNKVGTTWAQQAYVKASNASAGALFGTSLALSSDGNTLAVGAPWEASGAIGIGGDQNDKSAGLSGAVYLFKRAGEDWTQQTYVKASNTGAGDLFGNSLALSGDGNTLAVAAPHEDSNTKGISGVQSDNSAADAGAVYVFKNAAGWSQQAYIKASNTGAGDIFGSSLALDSKGDVLVIGAYKEDSNTKGVEGVQNNEAAEDSGAAYVFKRAVNTWSQQAYLKASNAEASDYFGFSVALSADGQTIVVGAMGENGADGDPKNNGANYAGAAYVFKPEAPWVEMDYLKPTIPGVDDKFGWSVAVNKDGSIVAVGAHLEDSKAIGVGVEQGDKLAGDAGGVYVFQKEVKDEWPQRAYIKAPNTDKGDLFGQSVALSEDGDTLAVGAEHEDSKSTGVSKDQTDVSAADAGAVYLY